VILLDTSGLLAALDGSQRLHREAAASLMAARPPLLLSPFVLAELDYLLTARVGTEAQAALLEEVERGAYRLEPFSGGDVGEARKIVEGHADLRLSLADASVAVLAARHEVDEVLTLDQRRFRVLTAAGRPFRVLPADATRA
jgi:predicted nucleic acid-binding protein